MQWLSQNWEMLAGAVGAAGTLWKMLRASEKSYRSHLSAHFPTKREFIRLELKVDRLIAMQLGQPSHLLEVPHIDD